METSRMAASGMKSLRWIGCVSLILLSWAQCEGSVVTVALHGTAVLPCSVSFISGTDSLHVIWAKRPQGPNEKQFSILHSFDKGRYNLEHQAPQYTGRTNMSTDLSTGRLDLTLTHVERRDEGVYICQVTDKAGYGDIEVRLSVIVPVSDPVLNISCKPNSSAEISCWVQDGTDPEYSLSVNGRIELEDSGSSLSGVNVTVSSAAPWNITCSVRNRISERNSSWFYESCAAHGTHGGAGDRTWLLVSLCIGFLGLSGCALYLYKAHGTHGGVVGRTWLLVSLCIVLLVLSGCAALSIYLYKAHRTHGGVVGRTWLWVSLCIVLLGLSGCAALYLYKAMTSQTCRRRKKETRHTEVETVDLEEVGDVGVKDEKSVHHTWLRQQEKSLFIV